MDQFEWSLQKVDSRDDKLKTDRPTSPSYPSRPGPNLVRRKRLGGRNGICFDYNIMQMQTEEDRQNLTESQIFSSTHTSGEKFGGLCVVPKLSSPVHSSEDILYYGSRVLLCTNLLLSTYLKPQGKREGRVACVFHQDRRSIIPVVFKLYEISILSGTSKGNRDRRHHVVSDVTHSFLCVTDKRFI